jgi:hypothetical protein
LKQSFHTRAARPSITRIDRGCCLISDEREAAVPGELPPSERNPRNDPTDSAGALHAPSLGPKPVGRGDRDPPSMIAAGVRADSMDSNTSTIARNGPP